MRKKIIVTVCASLVLISGIVTANYIKNQKMSLDIEYVELDRIGAEVSVESLTMDNLSLTTSIAIKFDEYIKDKVDIDKVYSIELGDFIVRDEEDRIIYCICDEEIFEEYCKENNLDYTYGKFNENYINCGLYDSIEYKRDNLVKLNYKMYTEDSFPKSKKLYFSLGRIRLNTGLLDEEQIVYEIKGDWNFVKDIQ